MNEQKSGWTNVPVEHNNPDKFMRADLKLIPNLKQPHIKYIEKLLGFNIENYKVKVQTSG